MTTDETREPSAFALWFKDAPHAWRRPSTFRFLGVISAIGVIGDALTTSVLEFSDRIIEVNPFIQAGQEWLGSPAAFMVLISLPLLFLVWLIPSFPTSAVTRMLWASALCLGIAKFVATLWNLSVFFWVHFHLGGLF